MKPAIKFISEARNELMKVNWPTRQAAVNLTLTVLGVSLAFALYITGVDLLLTEGVKWVTSISQGEDEPIKVPTGTVNIGGQSVNIGDLDVETQPAN